jgi:hypothetical protein
VAVSVRIAQGQARELILPQMQCIEDVCPGSFFWEPISRSLSIFFNEEDE